MSFRVGRRVVCVFDSGAFIAVVDGRWLGIPSACLGIACPQRDAVYTVKAVVGGWRGCCLELAQLLSRWDARAFRPAVEDSFEALRAIAADPSSLTPAPLPNGRGETVPEAEPPLPPLRTPAPSDLADGAGEGGAP
jgi:hypothetical protein